MLKHLIIILSIFFGATPLFSQERIPLNSWRVHISYADIQDIAFTDNGVYAAARQGMFLYDFADQSVNTITSLDGLNPSAISAIAYDEGQGLLFVGHENGMLEIIGNEILTFNELSLDSRDDKAINDILLLADEVYLSTDIGVLVFDRELNTFSATYDELGLEGDDISISQALILEEVIYAASAGGVLSANLNSNNLTDFRQWSRYKPNLDFSSLTFFQGQILAAAKMDSIFSLNGTWSANPALSGLTINEITADGDQLLIATGDGVLTLDDRGEVINATENLGRISSVGRGLDQSIYAGGNGLIKIDNAIEIIRPTGPTVEVRKMVVAQDRLYGLPGRNDNDIVGYSIFNNGQWENYNPNSLNSNFVIPEIINAYDVEEFNGEIFISSYGSGLLRRGSGGNIVWDAQTENVPFEEFNNETRITGLASTPSGLWILNYGASQPLHFYNGQSFTSYNLPSRFLLDIEVSPEGILVIRIDPDNGGGIILLDPDTNEQRVIDSRQSSGLLPSRDVLDVLIESDGRLWVTTTDGVAYFSSATNALYNQEEAIRPILDGRFLFRNIPVNSMLTDGGGRKWFATIDGLWLFDSDVNENIEFFNQENSQLLSNDIFDLMLFQKTGELFIATSDGLISYRTASSTPEVQDEAVKIFPNPVTPDFSGTVGITGIAPNVIVKITDVNGNLVYQTRANGSTAKWDLLTVRGEKVNSGIYLVFTSDDNGDNSQVGKIAVIR